MQQCTLLGKVCSPKSEDLQWDANATEAWAGLRCAPPVMLPDNINLSFSCNTASSCIKSGQTEVEPLDTGIHQGFLLLQANSQTCIYRDKSSAAVLQTKRCITEQLCSRFTTSSSIPAADVACAVAQHGVYAGLGLAPSADYHADPAEPF